MLHAHEHPHHGRLAGAGRHLAGVARERLDALGHVLGRHVDALQQVGARLGEEDDRLGRLELGEEQRLLRALAAPVVDQVERRARRARIPGLAPLREPLADQIDELELLPVAARGLARLGRRRLRVAVEVAGPPPARARFGACPPRSASARPAPRTAS